MLIFLDKFVVSFKVLLVALSKNLRYSEILFREEEFMWNKESEFGIFIILDFINIKISTINETFWVLRIRFCC